MLFVSGTRAVARRVPDPRISKAVTDNSILHALVLQYAHLSGHGSAVLLSIVLKWTSADECVRSRYPLWGRDGTVGAGGAVVRAARYDT